MGSFKKLVTSRLKWASHVEHKAREKLVERAEAQKVMGKRRQGRLRLYGEDLEIGMGNKRNGEQEQKTEGIGDCRWRK